MRLTRNFSDNMEMTWIHPSSLYLLVSLTPISFIHLLFQAGLFSAVSSAFIIKIQPELRPDPETQALPERLLVQNINGAALVSLPTRPTTIVIIAQSLLYSSLSSTLLASGGSRETVALTR
jgi:hypothetical protein